MSRRRVYELTYTPQESSLVWISKDSERGGRFSFYICRCLNTVSKREDNVASGKTLSCGQCKDKTFKLLMSAVCGAAEKERVVLYLNKYAETVKALKIPTNNLGGVEIVTLPKFKGQVFVGDPVNILRHMTTQENSILLLEDLWDNLILKNRAEYRHFLTVVAQSNQVEVFREIVGLEFIR